MDEAAEESVGVGVWVLSVAGADVVESAGDDDVERAVEDDVEDKDVLATELTGC